VTQSRLPVTERQGHVKDAYRTVTGVFHVIVVRNQDTDIDRDQPDPDEVPAWVLDAIWRWAAGTSNTANVNATKENP